MHLFIDLFLTTVQSTHYSFGMYFPIFSSFYKLFTYLLIHLFISDTSMMDSGEVDQMSSRREPSGRQRIQMDKFKTTQPFSFFVEEKEVSNTLHYGLRVEIEGMFESK